MATLRTELYRTKRDFYVCKLQLTSARRTGGVQCIMRLAVEYSMTNTMQGNQ